jgi:hypothetical protein
MLVWEVGILIGFYLGLFVWIQIWIGIQIWIENRRRLNRKPLTLFVGRQPRFRPAPAFGPAAAQPTRHRTAASSVTRVCHWPAGSAGQGATSPFSSSSFSPFLSSSLSAQRNVVESRSCGHGRRCWMASTRRGADLVVRLTYLSL